MQQAPPSCPTPGHLRAHNSKPTSGHLKVKILNRPLDTENVKPKNRSEQPLDAETSVATERHQAKESTKFCAPNMHVACGFSFARIFNLDQETKTRRPHAHDHRIRKSRDQNHARRLGHSTIILFS